MISTPEHLNSSEASEVLDEYELAASPCDLGRGKSFQVSSVSMMLNSRNVLL